MLRWLGLALMLLGCSDDAQLPPVRARLGRLEYRSDTELSSCTAAPERVLAHIELVEKALDVRGPDSFVYVHQSDPLHAAIWPCLRRDESCTVGNTIYSAAYAQVHEVVHAVLSGIDQPSALFVEGVATAFGLNSVSLPLSSDPWQDLVRIPVGSSEPKLYSSGAALASYLYGQYGAAKLIDLYRRASTDATATAARFEDIYGASLDDAWAEAHQSKSPYTCPGIRDNTSLEWGENDVPDGECPGPVDSLRHVFSFDALTAVATATPDFDAPIRACDPAGAAPWDLFSGEWSPTQRLYLARWDAGQYFVERDDLGGASAADQSFRMRVGSFIGSDCNDAMVPLHLDEAPPEILLSMLPPRDGLIAIEWAGTEPLAYRIDGIDAGTTHWQVCEDCTLAKCTDLMDHQALSLKPGVTWIAVSQNPQQSPTTAQLFIELADQ